MSSADQRSEGFHLAHGEKDGDEGLEFDNSGGGPLRVPGFGGLPVTAQRTPAERFAHGSHDWAQPRLTAREMAMLRVMNLVTDTPDWQATVFDDEAVSRLRPDPMVQPLISDAAWSWCVAELRDKAERFKSAGYVSVFDSGSCVVKSDALISPDLLERLDAEVEVLAAETRHTQQAYHHLHPDPPPPPTPLTDFPTQDRGLNVTPISGADAEEACHAENVREEDADSPDLQMVYGSPNLDFRSLESLLGNQTENPLPLDPEAWPWVLRLIDPSMFPLVYGRTKVLSDGGQVGREDALSMVGQGETAPDAALGLTSPEVLLKDPNLYDQVWRGPRGAAPYRWSGRFQWLPSEVSFAGEPGTTDVQITTYINNLHPVVHKQLYSTIQDIISLSLDPWNEVLVWRERYRKPPRILTFGVSWFPPYPDWAYRLEALDMEKQRQANFIKTPDEWSEPIPDTDIEALNRDYGDAREKVLEFLSLPDPIFDHYHPPGGPPPELGGGKLKDVVDFQYNRIKTTWSHPEPGVSFTYPEWKAGRAGRAIVPPRRRSGWRWNAQPTTLPDHEFYTVCLQNTFHRQGLQVIVRLTSIELTPEEPVYT